MKERVDIVKKCSEIIAEVEGVSPEEVTVEYIRQQRESGRFDNVRRNIGSRDYSPYGVGLAFLTKNELDDIYRRVNNLINL